MNKRGFELSVNFLVIIILSIAMLGVGMMLFYKIMNVSDNIRTDLDQQTLDRLNRAMDDGSLIYIPDVTKTTTYGEYAYFGLGIRNELGAAHDFQVIITSSPPNSHFNMVYDTTSFSLDNNAKTYVLIAIGPKEDVSAPDLDQYGFEVRVECKSGPSCLSPQLYTNQVQMIYVNVA